MFCLTVNAQKIQIKGHIFGFKGEKVALIKKAQKNINFEGPLNDVSITVSGGETSIQKKTNSSGSFSFYLDKPGQYQLVIQKSAFTSLKLKIDYREPGPKKLLESFYFIMKEGETEELTLGELIISAQSKIQYNSNPVGGGSDAFQSNVRMLEKTCVINNLNHYSDPSVQEVRYVSSGSNLNPGDTVVPKSILLEKKVTPSKLAIEIPQENISDYETKLKLAKDELSRLDSTDENYYTLKSKITAMEQMLNDKQLLIELKESQIESKNKILTYLSLCIASVMIIAIALVFLFLQKRKYANVLRDNNRKITRLNNKLLSSIRYASLIQNGFLQNNKELKKLFPDSFIFNSPKDILSGDFYWFNEINGNKIIIAADCTGHGVPGALLTVLGHNAIHNIINHKKITDPGKIIGELNKEIINTFFKNSENADFSMDITVANFNKQRSELTIAGLTNGIYVHRNDKLEYIAVNHESFGKDLNDVTIRENTIQLKKNDSVYLFSDGYQDQFRKDGDRFIKFNLERFEKTLKEISTSQKFESGNELLASTMSDWRNGQDQTDDMLIIGIKL